jgi:nicotinamide riboside kinase
MKVWCEYVFNQCHTWILNRIVERKYDYYLLCKPDLPWVKDELREYPNEKPRQELYHIYRDNMTEQEVPWALISGSYEERLQQAISIVDKWCLQEG